jgi:hypothetical protein
MNNILQTVFKDLIKKGILIVEQDDAEEVGSEGKGGTRTVLKLPKFKINEKNWGKTLETDDRAIIERIGAQLKGDDPLARVEYLQKFLSETESVKSDVKVGEVMGTLMFLDIFASVVFDFNASVAGFLFEALFAGIFEGFQIEAKEGGGEAGTTDVILNVRPKGKGAKSGVEYSFKLLSAANPEIKGSFKDLVDGISKSPDAQETYLVVLKSGDEGRMNLDFYEYDIGQKNWFEWVGVPKVGTAPVLAKAKFNLQKGQYPQMPKGVKITAGRAETGKLFNGEFIKKATKPASARDAYNKIEAEEVLVIDPSPQAITDEYALTKDGERVTADDKLIVGQEYEINAVAGTKRVVDYKRSANFVALYGEFLKPGRFVGPNGEDFLTYVGEGVYKEDPEFFTHPERGLKTLGTYTGKGGAGQFKTRGNYMINHPNVRGPNQLTLDRDKFQAAAAAYTSLVGKQIYEVFTDMANLIEDVSGYYLGADVKERFEKGYAAQEEAKRLAKSTEKNFKDIEVEEETRKALAKSAQRRAARRSGYDTGAGKYGGGLEESKVVDLNDFSKKILENIKKSP